MRREGRVKVDGVRVFYWVLSLIDWKEFEEDQSVDVYDWKRTFKRLI